MTYLMAEQEARDPSQFAFSIPRNQSLCIVRSVLQQEKRAHPWALGTYIYHGGLRLMAAVFHFRLQFEMRTHQLSIKVT